MEFKVFNSDGNFDVLYEEIQLNLEELFISKDTDHLFYNIYRFKNNYTKETQILSQIDLRMTQKQI